MSVRIYDSLQDARFVFRTLRRNPGFVAVSTLSLALGIGLNVSLVSYINALFIRPLPGVPDSDRFISVYHRTAAGSLSSSSYPEYEYYRDHNRLFTGMLAYLRVPLILRVGDESEQVFGELVSGNYFSVLAMRPALGRFLKTPPHCLKKNGISARLHSSRILSTHFLLICRLPGLDSPPTITQSIP